MITPNVKAMLDQRIKVRQAPGLDPKAPRTFVRLLHSWTAVEQMLCDLFSDDFPNSNVRQTVQIQPRLRLRLTGHPRLPVTHIL